MTPNLFNARMVFNDIIASLLLFCFALQESAAFAQTLSPAGELLQRIRSGELPLEKYLQQKHLVSQRASLQGNSKTDLCWIDWVNEHGVSCSVRIHNNFNASYIFGEPNPMKAPRTISLQDGASTEIKNALDNLPDAGHLPPEGRWLVVSGLRYGEWFHAVYDRQDIPPPLERILDLLWDGIGRPWLFPEMSVAPTPLPSPWSTQAYRRSLTITENNRLIFLPDAQPQLWDLTTLSPTETATGAPRIQSLAGLCRILISPNGRHLAELLSGRVWIYDLTTGSNVWRSEKFPMDRIIEPRGGAVGPDGKFYFSFSNRVDVCDPGEAFKLETLIPKGLPNIQITADGKRLVSIVGGASVWDLSTRSNIARVRLGPQLWVGASDATGDRIAFAQQAGSSTNFLVWSMPDGGTVSVPKRGDPFYDGWADFAWSPDGRHMAAMDAGGRLFVYRTLDWKILAKGTTGRHGDIGRGMCRFISNTTLLALDAHNKPVLLTHSSLSAE